MGGGCVVQQRRRHTTGRQEYVLFTDIPPTTVKKVLDKIPDKIMASKIPQRQMSIHEKELMGRDWWVNHFPLTFALSPTKFRIALSSQSVVTCSFKTFNLIFLCCFFNLLLKGVHLANRNVFPTEGYRMHICKAVIKVMSQPASSPLGLSEHGKS